VAQRTRIPEEHLSTIEADRFDLLPAGPYAKAWVRTYCELVGVDEPVEMPDPGDPPMVPLNVVRGVGLSTLFAALVLLAWTQWGPTTPVDPGPPAPRLPDQAVSVAALRSVPLKVTVDGQPTYDAVLVGGASIDFEGHDEIAVEVPAVDAVHIRYNGQRIIPQGRQDAPRRIVFVDDGAP
jgi:hypothetical protein